MLTQRQIDAIVQAIYSIPELNGVVVGLYANNQCSVANAGTILSTNYRIRAAIIEETGALLPPGTALPDPPDPAVFRQGNPCSGSVGHASTVA